LALKEGIRIELNGGNYTHRKQRAVIEFICDPGSKTESASNSIYKDHVGKRALDDRSDNNDSNLTYIKYELDIQEPDTEVLLLEWRTKYVCETQGEDRTQRSHWGFFTWFLIM
jgi:autophagy-related protein 27